jgi:hypothetical protein
MAGQNQPVTACAEFEGLLSEALDKTLTGNQLQRFQIHGQACKSCGAMLWEAETGRALLHALGQVEPPDTLVNNILTATSGLQARRSGAAMPLGASWWEQFRVNVLTPTVAIMRQPRFAMSFGMVFFAVSICLSLAGVKVSDLRAADLRPSTLKRNYYETSGRVVKYYENIRVVYEMESRVQEFKRVTAPAEPRQEEQNKEHKNDTSGRPDQKQDRNYSLGESNPVLAEQTEPGRATGSAPRRFL